MSKKTLATVTKKSQLDPFSLFREEMGRFFDNSFGPRAEWMRGADLTLTPSLDIKESDKLNKAALKALFKEAIAYNKSHNVPKSKGAKG